MMPGPQRINKYLSSLGYGSRRQIDALIKAGRIVVNNRPASLGQTVTAHDRIAITDAPVSHAKREKVIIAFHKPRGVTTTKQDPFAKRTVMDYLPPKLQHLFPIGRLDRDSRGLLLLTNDGELAQKLTHPSFSHEKEYAVIVSPLIKMSSTQFTRDIKRLTTTIVSPKHQTKPLRVLRHNFNKNDQTGHVALVLQEGKKRQIRELFRTLGYRVIDLQRTRVGNIRLADLPEGGYVTISPKHFL